jgi:hypothetical protein
MFSYDELKSIGLICDILALVIFIYLTLSGD